MAEGPAKTAQSKVHTSALCWIPRAEHQGPIQALRQQYDRQIDRWPPHVNVLYPFVPAEHFEVAAASLAKALRVVPAFSVTLGHVDSFQHSKNSTAWLSPTATDETQWAALHMACQSTFPQCAADRAFVPHLTIGQFKSEKPLATFEAQMARRWEPLTSEVAELCLIARVGNEPFRVHWRIPLGGAVRSVAITAHLSSSTHQGGAF